MSDRSEYFHERYMSHKQEYADKHIQTYKSYDSYVKYKDIKKILVQLKKEIGEMNYERILDEVVKLERIRLHAEAYVDSED